ncbi:GNAT family N-acetyltransferase [Legionella pneumophila]|nr:GNAT family N-acetyltransferase [Legionella pneumophila]
MGLKKLNHTEGEVKKFFIAPKYRGLGLAQKLMLTLVKNAMKHGFKKLFLGTVAQLNAARRFYEKNGFVLVNRILYLKNLSCALWIPIFIIAKQISWIKA